MTPERIKAIRAALGENTKTFGQRFLRSGRAVEEWEQGRRVPDPLIQAELAKLEILVKNLEKKSR